MKIIVQTGRTSKRDVIFIGDSSVTTGAGKTGLTNASLTAYYFRDGDATATVHTLAAGTVGTWSSGGFKEIDATNMPGMYEVGIFNAVFANTVDSARVMFKGAGLVPVIIEYQVVPWNPQDAVRLGLTSLPNVAQGSAGQLATGSSTGQVTVATNNDKTGYALTVTPPTASAIATASAAAILTTPANLLSTDASGRVTPVPSTIPTTAQIAASILATPAHLIAVDASGNVSVAGGFPTVGAIAAAILAVPGNLLMTDASGNVISSVVLGPVGSVAGGVAGSIGGSMSGNVLGSVAFVVDPVELDMTQAVPMTNAAQSLGDSLNAARAQGFGRWTIDSTGLILTLLGGDNMTVVRTFTLNDPISPTART